MVGNMQKYRVVKIPREMIHCPLKVDDIVIITHVLNMGFVDVKRLDGTSWILNRDNLRRV